MADAALACMLFGIGFAAFTWAFVEWAYFIKGFDE